VDADANGANDGSSWADAYKYLQDALAAADTKILSGDELICFGKLGNIRKKFA